MWVASKNRSDKFIKIGVIFTFGLLTVILFVILSVSFIFHCQLARDHSVSLSQFFSFFQLTRAKRHLCLILNTLWFSTGVCWISSYVSHILTLTSKGYPHWVNILTEWQESRSQMVSLNEKSISFTKIKSRSQLMTVLNDKVK